jgi:hypothetical protein
VHFSPSLVTVAAIPATASPAVIRGRARQVRVTWQNRRCPVLFHLLVPGGKCMTSVRSPVPAARTASWSFRKWLRQSLAPPASQTISSRAASG